jgi:hypothetical protein
MREPMAFTSKRNYEASDHEIRRLVSPLAELLTASADRAATLSRILSELTREAVDINKQALKCISKREFLGS